MSNPRKYKNIIRKCLRINFPNLMIVIFVIFPLLTLFVHKPSTASAFRDVKVGDEAPNFTLADINGEQVSLSDFKDKVVAVIFWSAVKKKSIDALVILETVYKEYKDKDVVVIGINTDIDKEEEVKKVVKEKKISFPVLLDRSRRVYGDYGVFITPSIGLINKEGKMAEEISYSHSLDEIITGKIKVILGLITEAELEAELHPQREPERSPEEKKASRYVDLGQVLLRKGMTDKALDKFQKALETYPDFTKARLLIALIYVEEEKIDEAIAEFNIILEKDPKSIDAKVGLGSAFVLKGEIDKAIEILEGTVKLNPDPAKAHYELGKAYEKKGELEKAVVQYRSAIEELFKDRSKKKSKKR